MSEKLIAKKVRIDRIYPDNLQSNFVSNIVVQHQPDHFILSFFEVWPPAILGNSDAETQKVLDSVDRVDAKCVARLVLTPARMKEFVQLISENLVNYEHMMQNQADWAQEG
jgi:hypothetical protein